MRRYDDPVEVRTGAEEDPEQFLWRGRLWQVREVVAHWVETGAWWSRPAAGVGSGPGGAGADLLREQEVWRVTAARGRVAALATIGGGAGSAGDPGHDLGYGVFDLVFSWADGSWQLVRAMD